ncbi:hypothetical protein [Lactobacillus plantarum] [Lactiplantibacillus mudanjiangensis]|uniref:helix-turn-helix domain-containing protein n=1 Tax=Lactiplantibacillus mudanjiangensis TaxID=1296538 RepID=UPI00101475BE|nr:hypothetical protein [Lactobacillus plantarum] [Lactiplantibacillus mudanjiangensis]
MSLDNNLSTSFFDGKADRIKQARKDANLTQTQLADLYNQFLANNKTNVKPVSYATISRWENGETAIKPEPLAVLSKVLNVDDAYLAGYQKESKSSKTISLELIDSVTELQDLKYAISDIVADLYDTIDQKTDEIDYLQHQIDTINHPENDEDPY